jgi:hypothetical protein
MIDAVEDDVLGLDCDVHIGAVGLQFFQGIDAAGVVPQLIVGADLQFHTQSFSVHLLDFYICGARASLLDLLGEPTGEAIACVQLKRGEGGNSQALARGIHRGCLSCRDRR